MPIVALFNRFEMFLTCLSAYAVYKEYEVLGIYTEHISGAKKNGECSVLRKTIERCWVEAWKQVVEKSTI